MALIGYGEGKREGCRLEYPDHCLDYPDHCAPRGNPIESIGCQWVEHHVCPRCAQCVQRKVVPES